MLACVAGGFLLIMLACVAGGFFWCVLRDSFVAAKVKQENEGEEKRKRGKEETHFTVISFTLRIAVDEKNRLLRKL